MIYIYNIYVRELVDIGYVPVCVCVCVCSRGYMMFGGEQKGIVLQ